MLVIEDHLINVRDLLFKKIFFADVSERDVLLRRCMGIVLDVL